MNERYFPRLKSGIFAAFAVMLSLMQMGSKALAQEKPATADTIKKLPVRSKQAVKEEENRNVMLNAANNNGPREVNIGLPASVGGTTILENDLPVVYYFWPELPNRTWRSSVSLSRSGLQSLREQALLMGDFGYAVNSYTKLGGDSLEVTGAVSGSHFGWLKGDFNVSGPITKGWSYSAGAYANYDPMTFDPGFTRYSDRTQIYRAGITKRFNNGRGEISLLYKYAQSFALPTNFAAFTYQEGGEITQLSNFRLGLDSYLKGDGKYNLISALTGKPYEVNLADASTGSSRSHNIDLMGNYQLKNDWNFKYIVRYHQAEVANTSNVLVGIKQAGAADGYTYMDGTSYTGPVQTVLAGSIPKTPIHAVMSRFELNKQSGNHALRFGITESYHKVTEFSTDRAVFFQEVAAQPRQLLGPGTDAAGYNNYNGAAEYHNGFENKLTAYLSDNWNISDRFSLNYGANIRYHKLKGDYYAQARTAGFSFVGLEKSYFDYDWMHLGASANFVYKATDRFGFTADVIYTEKHGQLEDFSGGYNPDYKKTRSPYASVGVYYNSPAISIVSALTYLTRNNYIQRLNLVNPADATQSNVSYQQYDIKTTGWTTDIVAKPAKGFSLHYLITFQNPVYQNYDVPAFDNQYSFSGNNVLGVSKVLMEIDPSYSFKQWKVWGSARYFSKQYANLTNALFFKGWWETFAGVNFQAKKNIGLGLTVVNILNQNGAKGTINGAELISDPSLYYGRVLTSQFIRPFTVEASLNFKF